MINLKELEDRLRNEPDNLGLRVMLAGALHEAGRRDDALALYRSVAIAYRDQGRPQQAITVCRSILELAPDNAACQELLAALIASQQAPRASPPPPQREPASPVLMSPLPQREPPSPGWPPPAPQRPSPVPQRPSPVPQRSSPVPPERPSPAQLRLSTVEPETEVAEPPRRSSIDVTPLPVPLPYHEADPTGSLLRLSRSDLPQSLQDELASFPEIAGIAAAARQISASLIAAARRDGDTEELDEEDLVADVDTGKLTRTRAARATPSASVPPPLPRPPTAPEPPGPVAAGGDDDEPTLPPPPARAVPRLGALEDEKTQPRELPRARPPSIAPPTAATGPLAGAFFAPLPPRNRASVLQRFRRRIVPAGATVIRRGETGHGLIVVVRGRLELRTERTDGVPIPLGAIAAGEFIGEASLLARAPAAAQVIAETDAELLVLSPEDFYDVTSAFPALRSELEAVAARRAQDHQRQLG
jgi:hypothetical protein